MTNYHIGIDLGATSGRVVLGCKNQYKTFDIEVVHRFENRLMQADGHWCWDIDALWHVKECLEWHSE